MSVIDKFHSLQAILNVMIKVITVADKLIDFVIQNIETKGA